MHLAAKSGDKSGLITVSCTSLFDCGSRQLYIFSLSYTDSIESYGHKVSEGDVQISNASVPFTIAHSWIFACGSCRKA
jgi:hypothetical protein